MKYLGKITDNKDLVTKEYVDNECDEKYNEILSRGEQLVINGNGFMGDNTNFHYWIYDGSHANGSPASFTRTQTTYVNISSDYYFPVNPSLRYKISFDAITANGLATLYSYASFCDIDKISIGASNHMYYPNTLTTLTEDLKPGDTVVHLASVANYQTYGSASHQRALIFWDYKNSFGYQYPPETYSRYTLMPAWTDNSSIDATNNTITLTTAYSGVTHKAGSYVSQGNSGGTYKYNGAVNSLVPTTWTTYKGYYDGTDYSGTNVYTKFPPGTAYAKIGFLWNYNSANDQIWATNISFYSTNDEQYLIYGGVDTGLGSSSPASNAKTYYLDGTKVPKGFIKAYQNSSGDEYTLLFCNRNDTYGTILKWGYKYRYLYMLRRYNNSWQSDDWEKIYAGYADSSNSAITATQLSQQTTVNASTINDFRGNYLRFSRVTNLPDVGLASNDGMVIWIPFSDTYGQQLLFDDTVSFIKTRFYSNGTWGAWGANLASLNAQINALSTGSSTPDDADYYISQYAGGGSTTTTYHRRPMSALWSYISGKISSILGLTASNYSGKAATAGTADSATNASKVNNLTVQTAVPVNAVFTDTKVTAVGNHYTPSGGTTTSASGATGTSGTTVQVVTGVTKDAAGHVTGITSGAATDTTYESKSAASGGTAVSLVTTGEKYTWNNKSTVPTNHASTGTGYGTGSSSNYGHVKLSDSTSSTSGTSGGIAATPSAVKSAYDLANTANGTANTALSGVNGGLIYDHTFTISNGVATFTPHVYKAGAEVTTDYATSCFVWKYRLIDGSEVALTTKSDRGCDVTISNMGYGGHVIGLFTPA